MVGTHEHQQPAQHHHLRRHDPWAHIAAGRNGRISVAWNGSVKGAEHGTPSPMPCSRLNDAGTAFEGQRNLIKRACARETKWQVFFAPLTTPTRAFIAASGGGKNRKHPVLAVNAREKLCWRGPKARASTAAARSWGRFLTDSATPPQHASAWTTASRCGAWPPRLPRLTRRFPSSLEVSSQPLVGPKSRDSLPHLWR